MKYFEDSIQYAGEDVIFSGLLPNLCIHYISSCYLNGVVNYTTPVVAFLARNYRNENELNDEIVKKKLEELKESPHAKLDVFGDEALLVAKLDTSNVQAPKMCTNCLEYEEVPKDENHYVYFRFDHDVSDCSVGRFVTSDNIEQIKQELVNAMKKRDISAYWEIPVEYIRGWISFL